jgi:hypothetical protein
MGMRDLLQHISEEVCRWPHVTAAPHRFVGTEYRFSQAEIGHLHRDGTLDIPYPMPIRNRLTADGIVEKHHFLPESGWVRFHVTVTNLEQALWLLRLSYLRYVLRRASNADGSARPEYQSILQELETTTGPSLSAAMIRSHAPQPRA